MRTSLRRALTGASALTMLSAALVLGATPASAESSAFCDQAGSTRVLTANDGNYKVWIYQPNSGEVHVCFGVSSYFRGDYVFTTGLSGSLVPTVTPDLSDDSCPDYFHLQDPVDVLVEFRADTSGSDRSVCFGTADGSAIRIGVVSATGTVSPETHLWLDHGATVTDYVCLVNTICSNYYDGVKVF